MWSKLGLLIVLGGLAACGFRPLYGPQAGYDQSLEEFASISIAPIPDRIGQILRNELRDRLTPRGVPRSPRYRLAIVMGQTKEGLAFEKDETVTRFNLVVRATYQLVDVETGTVLTSGAARSVAAFNVVLSEFANIAAEADAESRTAKAVGEDIWVRLGVFFSRVIDARS